MREEYKLVFLTLLVRLGLGTLFVYIVTSFWVHTAPEYLVSAAALTVTLSGLALSLLHVGRPTRILNTLRNRKSLMSWEAIVSPPLLLAIILLVLCSYFYPESKWLSSLRVFVLLLTMAFIFITGKVYHLRARPSWSTPLVLYEYFTSAAIMGFLGFGFILVITKSLTPVLSLTIGYTLSALIVAEAIITYAYRARAIRLTVTARKALSEHMPTKRLYFWFVALGLMAPAALALSLVFGANALTTISAALGMFLLGAMWWRVLFFRSATLIKITPDISI